MKLNLTIALIIATSISAVCAPPQHPAIEDFGKKESFVMKGKVDPGSGNKFSMAVTGYITNEGVELPIDENGEFCETIPMTGPLQEAYIYVDKTVTIPVAAGDTIVATYINNKLTLSSPNPDTDRDLRFANLRHDMMRKRFISINRTAVGALETDSAKNALIDTISSYISDYNRLITDFEKEHGTLSKRQYFINDAYFSPLRFLIRLDGMLDRVKVMPLESKRKKAYTAISSGDMIYPSTRDFAINYLRACAGETRDKIMSDEPYSYRAIKIARAMAPDTFMADLVNSNQLRVSTLFESYPDFEEYGDTALNDIQTPWLKEEIKKMIDSFKLTAPGRELPKLTLKDRNGKIVSLDSFKGKVVLLDIWAIGCGPCVKEFSVMDKFKSILGEQADDLQIITVCCNTPSLKNWEKAIDKYHLDDLNTMLVPEESDDLYSTLGWPTYVLIGRDGKIFEWNTFRPSIVIRMKQHNSTTPIDKALK